jgi:hypothetical protein
MVSNENKKQVSSKSLKDFLLNKLKGNVAQSREEEAINTLEEMLDALVEIIKLANEEGKKSSYLSFFLDEENLENNESKVEEAIRVLRQECFKAIKTLILCNILRRKDKESSVETEVIRLKERVKELEKENERLGREKKEQEKRIESLEAQYDEIKKEAEEKEKYIKNRYREKFENINDTLVSIFDTVNSMEELIAAKKVDEEKLKNIKANVLYNMEYICSKLFELELWTKKEKLEVSNGEGEHEILNLDKKDEFLTQEIQTSLDIQNIDE